jgi:hypothetical protein
MDAASGRGSEDGTNVGKHDPRAAHGPLRPTPPGSTCRPPGPLGGQAWRCSPHHDRRLGRAATLTVRTIPGVGRFARLCPPSWVSIPRMTAGWNCRSASPIQRETINAIRREPSVSWKVARTVPRSGGPRPRGGAVWKVRVSPQSGHFRDRGPARHCQWGGHCDADQPDLVPTWTPPHLAHVSVALRKPTAAPTDAVALSTAAR